MIHESDNNDYTHNTPSEKYNVFEIINGERELFTVEVTNRGVYFDHNMMNGCLFVSHEKLEKLDCFREEFLREIETTDSN
jgi:hypothetical protein